MLRDCRAVDVLNVQLVFDAGTLVSQGGCYLGAVEIYIYIYIHHLEDVRLVGQTFSKFDLTSKRYIMAQSLQSVVPMSKPVHVNFSQMIDRILTLPLIFMRIVTSFSSECRKFCKL